MSGCDEGFDELNTNKVDPTTVNPAYLLNRAIISSSGGGANLVYELGIVQYIISPNGGVLGGANFNQDNRSAAGSNWRDFYRVVLKHTTDVKRMTADDETRSNLYNMARIWHSYGAMVLTDTYGDVPYTEAGQGFLEFNVEPTYNTQQSIYEDVLRELEQATAGLDASKPIENTDILYGGNVEKWRRLGNSLMLRAAMRHTKVAPNVAQEYVAKAVAGGVMQSNDDNAVIYHNPNYTNGIGGTLNGGERNNFYLTQPFIDYLQENDDPRLASIAVRYVGAQNGGQQTPGIANRDPEVQIGMPLGHDNASIAPVASSLGLASFYDFSQLDRTRMGSQNAPAFLVTYAQTQLLLAEAAVRNWVQAAPAELYAEGIMAHMNQLAEYGPDVAIDPAEIEAYVQANPLDMGNALEEINTQYWLASFLDPYEAFANFRRSGYPDLPPNPFPGKEITTDFIRRLTFPDTVNLGNIQEANSRQGPDRLDTRVWWDQP
jgi:hypothetical protein